MATHLSITAALLLFVSLLNASPATGQPTARPPAGPAGTVTLSLAEYDRLVERAERLKRPAEKPPVPAVVSRAAAAIRVTGDRARGTFTLEGEVFATGVTRVPLMKGAGIVDARIGTTTVALLRDADTVVALIEGPRAFVLTLDWGGPVLKSPGRAALAVPVPTAGTVTAQFDLPGTTSGVLLQSGTVTRTGAMPNSTRVDATLVPSSQARISWAVGAADSQQGRDIRTLAAVHSLVSLREAEIRLASIVEVSVLSGQPGRFDVTVPSGYAFAGASGGSVETAEEHGGVVSVSVVKSQERRHQFILSFERQVSGGGTFEVPLPHVAGAEREAGEVVVEATGTVELTLADSDLWRRIDVRETGPALQAITGPGSLAALRYQRRGDTPLIVAGTLTRFADAPLVTAAADLAVATTLVTVDGRTLTEIALTVRNRAQPYLRVELPAGASMLSAEVAGEAAKLAHGPDGARVPLLRPGFRPSGPYAVSFVYVQPGQPLLKKGRAALALPKMDIAIGLVEWEMFVPDRYRVRGFEGDAMLAPVTRAADSSPAAALVANRRGIGLGIGTGGGSAGGAYTAAPGQVVGRVTHESGTVLPGARVTARIGDRVVAEAIANEAGWYLLPGISGRSTITVQLEGFKTATRTVRIDPSRPRQIDVRLEVGPITESLTVASESPDSGREQRDEAAQAPSQNVFNLQRRIEGVLPVRMDVPRTGAAYRFVRPLVVDEATTVSFDYRRR